MLFPEARSAHVRQRILTSDFFAGELKRLEDMRSHYLRTPVNELPFHEYERFFRDGNRVSFESLYFERRRRLSCLTAAVLLYGREEDLTALNDLLWAICGEYSWVLPAHAADLGTSYDRGVIDLFSAETGFALSEIRSLLADRLSPRVSQRILECVTERIIEPYISRSYAWETASHNWAAVCGGSVGAVFLYAAPEKFPLIRERLLRTMGHYLSGFGADGVCQEGLGYWNYGFGFYTFFAQLLFEYTDGEDNLFAQPPCPAIAAYQEHAFLRGNLVVSFSDGSRTGSFQPGLSCRLHEHYGAALPPRAYAAFFDDCFRIQPYLRNFFWTEPDMWNETEGDIRSRADARPGTDTRPETDTAAPSAADCEATAAPCTRRPFAAVPMKAHGICENYFPQAQWYIARSGSLSLAAKAGHNGEPHNHNDVGSFLLLSGEETVFCDFGAGEYTAAYFRPESRYDYLCNSSLGHSLPIIDGKGQKPGSAYRGKVLAASDGEFRIEIAGAYDAPGLRSIVRSLKLMENELLLTDCFVFGTADGSFPAAEDSLTAAEDSLTTAADSLTATEDILTAAKDSLPAAPRRVTERFVTLTKPSLAGRVLTVGTCRLEYDPAAVPRLSCAELNGHDGSPATLYFIDFDWDSSTPFRLRTVC